MVPLGRDKFTVKITGFAGELAPITLVCPGRQLRLTTRFIHSLSLLEVSAYSVRNYIENG